MMKTMIVIVPMVKSALFKTDPLSSQIRIAPLKKPHAKLVACCNVMQKMVVICILFIFSNTTGINLNNFGKYRIRQPSCCFQCLIYTNFQNHEFLGQAKEEEPCLLSSITNKTNFDGNLNKT